MRQGFSWPARLLLWSATLIAGATFVLADSKISTTTLVACGLVLFSLVRIAQKGRNGDYVVAVVAFTPMMWLRFWLFASCTGLWIAVALFLTLVKFRSVFERLDNAISTYFKRSKGSIKEGDFVTVIAPRVAPHVDAHEILERLGFTQTGGV